MELNMKKFVILILVSMSIFMLYAENSTPAKSKKNSKQNKPLVTFIELGSVTCIPCKAMQPVMKEVEAIYGNKVSVVFYDVNKEQQMAEKYHIKLIPTQVFLDKTGKEFYRHEGFFPKDEITKLIDKQIGHVRK